MLYTVTQMSLQERIYYHEQQGFIKEVLVMTLADAITAIAVYFFWCRATPRSAVSPVSGSY